jgi:hypothetical protein
MCEVCEREFAAIRCSAGTSDGISAPLAGLNNVPTVDMANPSAYIAHRLPESTAGIIIRVMPDRRKSDTSIVRRLSHLSTNTPASIPNNRRGSVNASIMPDTA